MTGRGYAAEVRHAHTGCSVKGGIMYIELFLIDNLLMNLLILRLAAALLSVKLSMKKALVASLLGACYAAAGAGALPFLLSPVMKIITCLLMTFALPFHGIKGYFLSSGALLLSSLTRGGTAVLAVIATGGGEVLSPSGAIRMGITLRAALAGAAAAVFLPGMIRRMLSRRVRNGLTVKLHIKAFRTEIECAALIDTGCLITEPVSGLPVIILNKKRYPLLSAHAALPVPIRTARGESVIFAMIPKKASVNGIPVAAAVAFAENDTALIPSVLINPDINKKTGGKEKNADAA